MDGNGPRPLRLLEPLYFLRPPNGAADTGGVPFPFDGVDVCLRWRPGSRAVQAILSGLRRPSKLLLTPWGLAFREGMQQQRRQLLPKIKQITPSLSLDTCMHAVKGRDMVPVVRPPLHPAAALHSTISSQAGNASSTTTQPGGSSSSSDGRGAAVQYDPIGLTLSLFGLSGATGTPGGQTSLSLGPLPLHVAAGLGDQQSHSPRMTSGLAGEGEELPLYIQSVSALDHTRFARGLQALRNAIHQVLLWRPRRHCVICSWHGRTRTSTLTDPHGLRVLLRERPGSKNHVSQSECGWLS